MNTSLSLFNDEHLTGIGSPDDYMHLNSSFADLDIPLDFPLFFTDEFHDHVLSEFGKDVKSTTSTDQQANYIDILSNSDSSESCENSPINNDLFLCYGDDSLLSPGSCSLSDISYSESVAENLSDLHSESCSPVQDIALESLIDSGCICDSKFDFSARCTSIKVDEQDDDFPGNNGSYGSNLSKMWGFDPSSAATKHSDKRLCKNLKNPKSQFHHQKSSLALLLLNENTVHLANSGKGTKRRWSGSDSVIANYLVCSGSNLSDDEYVGDVKHQKYNNRKEMLKRNGQMNSKKGFSRRVYAARRTLPITHTAKYPNKSLPVNSGMYEQERDSAAKIVLDHTEEHQYCLQLNKTDNKISDTFCSVSEQKYKINNQHLAKNEKSTKLSYGSVNPGHSVLLNLLLNGEEATRGYLCAAKEFKKSGQLYSPGRISPSSKGQDLNSITDL